MVIFNGYYQAQAVTPFYRSNADIKTCVLHTPEGGVSGTLGVLSGSRAGFDFFVPPSGEKFKCNDYNKYISWHAADWNVNVESVGMEQWDYASRMHLAPPEHYRRIAEIGAMLAETTGIQVKYGRGGFIYHEDVTPGLRCDPTNCRKSFFDIDQFLQYVLDASQGKAGSVETKGGYDMEKYTFGGLGWYDALIAIAASGALTAEGLSAGPATNTSMLAFAAQGAYNAKYRTKRLIVVGGSAFDSLIKDYQNATINYGEDQSDLLNAVGKDVRDTISRVKKHIVTIGTYEKMDSAKAVIRFKESLEGLAPGFSKFF